jgi:plasmid stabilization system protein ParE
MPRRVIFDPEARLEFEAAVTWHNQQQPGLGYKFAAEVWAIFPRILQSPERFRLVGRTVRVAKLKGFSRYAIYFHIEPDFIGVVSVFHSSRHPTELRRRLQ